MLGFSHSGHTTTRDRMLAAIHTMHFKPGDIVSYGVVAELKKRLIAEAPRMTDGNVLRAAKLLGVKRDRLRYQIQILHLRHLARAR